MDRLLLVRHGTTAETRHAAFPSTSGAAECSPCEQLDREGRHQATALRDLLPFADRAWSSHAFRSRQTAELAGLAAERTGDLAECDFGRWSGHAPAEVSVREPDALAAWYADPDTGQHGGERFSAVRNRARVVLGRAAGLGGTTVAVTHGGFIKAALVEALDLPSTALWRLDAAPGSVTELHPGPGGWRVVRVNWTPALTRQHAEVGS